MKIKPNVIIIGFVGIASLVFNFHQYLQKVDDEKRIASLQSQANKQSLVLTKYIAKDGTNHVIYKDVFVKSDAEKELAVSKGYLDTLRKALNISVSQITELTRVKATVRDIVKAQRVDSLNQTTYNYKNRWLEMSLNTRDSMLNYNYNVEFTKTKYTKGNWLVGRKEYVDLSLSDPHAQIEGVQTFTIPPEKPKRLGLGLQIGYRYDVLQNAVSPSIGLGLSYNFIRF